ncbi:alpha/beta-hydrolase [Cucurbitaria berberidis CBS 394.84]|uniref:Alpha/beta-hydrolase n=1 Tax=Cucurbitaria berberidis CBS 394.84 TaxID=1168544 RepID=A0A9P4G7D2_9PLEO|nr:alpha/beta-hydrolase [Cucurbitaria berberidis CBS 394.84]KAF1840403.1 alpha/beta-hydrolase [Cucurbitaria berberidis CBS 394.84]
MANPTILIVPGSFAGPGIYDNIVTLLRKQGYPAFAVQLPSTQKRMPLEPAGMQEDASVIRRAAEALLALGREIIVLCHSYGGTPATEGLAGLAVKRIIYLTAIAPKVGQNHVEAMALPEGFLPESTGGYMHMDAVQMAGAIRNDLPYEEAYPFALQLPYHSAISFQEPITQAAYKTIPVSYIVCERDMIINPDTQRRFIKTIEEESGREVDVFGLDSGHCPNWSQPEKLVEIIVTNADKQ